MAMSKTPVFSEKITLQEPIRRGAGDSAQVISEIQLRKPNSGELRGLSLVAIGQMDVNELRKLLPRISMPTILEPEIDALDPADLFVLAHELTDFLLPSSAKQASQPL
jgi:hypothetical protein